MAVELHGLAISPWTERARWALDHHSIPYRYREHLILFGEPWLRWKLRKPFGPLTVPALIDSGGVRLMDSFDIALYADTIGRKARLFPDELIHPIEEWHRSSESALDAARAIVTRKVGADREAQALLLPRAIPPGMREAMTGVARQGIEYIRRSFAVDAKETSARVQDLRVYLTALRKGLSRGGGYLLGGRFSFADITACVPLMMVRPMSGSKLDRHDAIRRCWTQDELAREFADLLEWRDDFVTRHRQGSAAVTSGSR